MRGVTFRGWSVMKPLSIQIAHMINQLVERSKQVVDILLEHSKQTIVDLWKKMIAYLIISRCEENTHIPYQPG